VRVELSRFNCYVAGDHEEDKDDEGELAAQLGAEPLSAESQVEEEQKLVQSEILGYHEVLAAAIPHFPSFPFQEWFPSSFSMVTYMATIAQGFPSGIIASLAPVVVDVCQQETLMKASQA